MAVYSDAYSSKLPKHDAVKPARCASSPRQTRQRGQGPPRGRADRTSAAGGVRLLPDLPYDAQNYGNTVDFVR